MTLPRWLLTRLENTGHIDPTTGATRRARLRPCPTCHQPTIIGFDDHIAARTCTLDPNPITALGEATALLTGRYTRTLWHRSGRLELGKRSHHQILAKPAGTPTNRFDVLAEHVCNTPPLPTTPSVHHNHTPTNWSPNAPAPF